jgi:hypothetical protein
LEPVVRSFIEQELGRAFPPVCAVKTTAPIFRASLDGLAISPEDGRPTVLEIKTLGAKAFAAAKKGIVPSHYLNQLQHNMLVVDAEEAIFAACPSLPAPDEALPITYFTVKADHAWREDYLDRATAFWRSILDNNPPPMTKPGFTELRDPDAVAAAMAYAKAALAMKEATAAKEKAEAQLMAVLPADESKVVIADTLAVSRYTVKGRVNNNHPDLAKRIAEALKGVDLELYRGRPTEAKRITLLGLDDFGDEPSIDGENDKGTQGRKKKGGAAR